MAISSPVGGDWSNENDRLNYRAACMYVQYAEDWRFSTLILSNFSMDLFCMSDCRRTDPFPLPDISTSYPFAMIYISLSFSRSFCTFILFFFLLSNLPFCLSISHPSFYCFHLSFITVLPFIVLPNCEFLSYQCFTISFSFSSTFQAWTQRHRDQHRLFQIRVGSALGKSATWREMVPSVFVDLFIAFYSAGRTLGMPLLPEVANFTAELCYQLH